MGYASALSFVLFLLIAIFSLINIKLTQRGKS
jgi:ABC-type sugar transport system permease subunit